MKPGTRTTPRPAPHRLADLAKLAETMAKKVPDFTDAELWTVQTTLRERYGEDIRPELGDGEIRMHPNDRELTEVPLAWWSQRGANFVIFKVDERRYRGQFYYRGYQQYGTGQPEFDDIASCVTTLLQVQADHERDSKMNGDQAPSA